MIKGTVINFLLSLAFLLGFQLFTYGQTGRNAKVNNLYHCLKEYDIKCPKTVLAIAIYETGWLECKDCAFQYNNLFGFRTNQQEYLKFKSIYECLDYFKKWETAFYDPWKEKHPNGTYYDYLQYVKFAHINMPDYVKTIKAIEKLVAKNVIDIDELLSTESDQEFEVLNK